MVCTALVAALALAAVASASALASPEWYVKKKGTWSKVTTAVNVVSPGTLELNYENGSEFIHFKCEKGITEGTINSGGLGTISVFKPSLKAGGCPVIKEERGFEPCSEIETGEAINLSWATELYLEGTEKRARIKPHSGGGTPNTRWTCHGPLGKDTFTCPIETTTRITNVLSLFVEAVFDSKSTKVACNGAEKANASWKGTLDVKPTEAEKTAGVEAIKVE